MPTLLIGLAPVFHHYKLKNFQRQVKHFHFSPFRLAQAQVGRARIYGTLWGEPMGTRMQPIAASGSYRLLASGETGRYYMQQWASPAARLAPAPTHAKTASEISA